MKEANSSLMSHATDNGVAGKSTQLISRADLALVTTPRPTRSHKPVAHIEIVETLEKMFANAQMEVKRQEFAVSKDGMRMFGVMDLGEPLTAGTTLSLGIRNSNNKSMALGMAAGYRVFVCDNMAFSSDFEPVFRKHTRRISVMDVARTSTRRLVESVDPIKKQIDRLVQFQLHDVNAKEIIYDAFTTKALDLPQALLPKVHDLYFHTEVPEFADRNLWSLSNAFTGAFKEMAPLQLFSRTAKLAEFIKQHLN